MAKSISKKLDQHFTRIETHIINAIFADGKKATCRVVSDKEIVAYVQKRMKATKADILLARGLLTDIAMGRFVNNVIEDHGGAIHGEWRDLL